MQGGGRIAECKKLTKTNSCTLFANLSKDSGTDVQSLLPPVQDIEGMVEAGKQHQLCRLSMARNRLETADMIFSAVFIRRRPLPAASASERPAGRCAGVRRG